MNFVPLPTEIFTKGEDLFAFFCKSLEKNQYIIEENTVVVISSKVVALSQNNISKKNLSELVEQESESILSQKGGFFLTEKNGILIPNAGIDQSNAQKGEKILWPHSPQQFTDMFRKNLQEKYFSEHTIKLQNIGVVISDSRITPRRRGTTGVALSWSGIEGVFDMRGQEDIYGKKLEVSTVNIADNIVSGAEIIMGQGGEKTPFVFVNSFPKKFFTSKPQDPHFALMPKDEDLFVFE